jgi:tRNA pseudouridine55 synthase
MPVFVVNKPLGLTSHDVVARTRKLLKTKPVGHAGTLDPLATGVLVVLTEDETKLSPFLTASEKSYLAWVSFGAGTPTLDAEGPVERTGDASRVTMDRLEAALPPFLTLTEQHPPQYSAIKKGGIKGYEAARRGEALELPPRPAGYRQIRLHAFAPSRDELPERFSLSPDGDWQPNTRGVAFALPRPLGSFPTALFSVTVQAGTYLRAFARDLGEALAVPAHLSGLVRTRAGRAGLEQAITLESLPAASGLRAAEALPYPLISLNGQEVARVRQGQRLPLLFEGRVGLVGPSGDLVAVAEHAGGKMTFLRVWQ